MERFKRSANPLKTLWQINIRRGMKDMIHRLLITYEIARSSPQDLSVVEKVHQHCPLAFTSADVGKLSIPSIVLRLEHKTEQWENPDSEPSSVTTVLFQSFLLRTHTSWSILSSRGQKQTGKHQTQSSCLLRWLTFLKTRPSLERFPPLSKSLRENHSLFPCWWAGVRDRARAVPCLRSLFFFWAPCRLWLEQWLSHSSEQAAAWEQRKRNLSWNHKIWV